MGLLENTKTLIQSAAHYGQLRRLVNESFSPSFFDTLRASRGNAEVIDDSLRMLSQIDRDAFSKIFEQFKDASPAPGFSKYLDASTHIARAVRSARRLGLQYAPPPLRLLDIGSGAGYFPFICQVYGNHATALDIGKNEMYVRLKALLHVECITHRIEAFQTMPLGQEKYDLVTGFQILFDRLPDGTPWSNREWEFFLKDVGSHILPGGRMVLELNTFPAKHRGMRRKNLKYFDYLGAIIQDQLVMIPGSVAAHPLTPTYTRA